MADADTLKNTPHLFARKFDPDNSESVRLLDTIDVWRAQEEE
jgi:hypothetical protein